MIAMIAMREAIKSVLAQAIDYFANRFCMRLTRMKRRVSAVRLRKPGCINHLSIAFGNAEFGAAIHNLIAIR
jgi:hypothetical protein